MKTIPLYGRHYYIIRPKEGVTRPNNALMDLHGRLRMVFSAVEKVIDDEHPKGVWRLENGIAKVYIKEGAFKDDEEREKIEIEMRDIIEKSGFMIDPGYVDLELAVSSVGSN